jgi:hypothetical protein
VIKFSEVVWALRAQGSIVPNADNLTTTCELTLENLEASTYHNTMGLPSMVYYRESFTFLVWTTFHSERHETKK